MSSRSTTDLKRALADIEEFARRLDPEALNRKVKWWRRYGLPSGSMGESSRSSETPLPLPDSFDEALKRTVLGYRDDIEQAAVALRRAISRQNTIMLEAPAVPDEARAPCGNLACVPTPQHPEWGYLEPGRQSGECTRCRVHRSRHGMAFPQQRAESA